MYSSTAAGRYLGSIERRRSRCGSPSQVRIVGLPKLRSIGEPGMSAANRSGSEATATAASQLVASHIPTAGTHATGDSARSRA